MEQFFTELESAINGTIDYLNYQIQLMKIYVYGSSAALAIIFLVLIIMFIRQSQSMGMIKKLIIDNRQLKNQLAEKGVIENGNIDK